MSYYVGKCHKEIKDRIYMSSERTCRETYFVNEDLDLVRQIVDPWGNLRNFPGVLDELDVEPIVHELIEFKQHENGFLVIWTIEKDYFDPGDEWGFGREEKDGKNLYSFLNNEGCYVCPFTKLENIINLLD